MNTSFALAAALALAPLACASTVVSSTNADAGATTTTTTGTGGAGGSGGSAGVGGAGGNVVEVPCACPDPVIGWTTLGGYVMWRDTVKIDGCATIRITREMLMGSDPNEPDRVCSHALAPCDAADPIGVDALAQALGQPDVKAALALAASAESEPLYGRDDRPTDGTLLRVTVGAASFLVGSACWEGDASCTPIPRGIAAMQQRLDTFVEAVEASAACVDVLAGTK